ncbi:neurogenic protein mastermind-like isoform X2 [Venturia canescens]|uniref:neurogenic protein mastermind-like isoform X2 n=1 Tax=Venturia canescens TaxID=32260 RepID=UPI001C9C9CF1|nr:neurogenic protein mastermind-like isoform X2 [Venturia canescens]
MEAGGLLPRQPPQGPPGTGVNVCTGAVQGHNLNLQQRLNNQSPLHPVLDLNSGPPQLSLTNHQQLQLQQQMGQAPGMGEVLTPKRQAVVDRLRRRITGYRRRQTDCIPRFDQSFNGLCEQNIQDTLVLKQRFLENKNKRQAKKTDKKQNENVGLSNVHVQKFLKRTAEDLEPSGGGGGDGGFGEPPVKLQCTQSQHQHQQAPTGAGGGSHHGHSQHPSGNGANTGPGSQGGANGNNGNGGNEGLTKFSVEIVQQLEFTTSAANSQAQQISTNVTVKALTNASVKSDHVNSTSSPKAGPDTTSSTNSSRTQAGGQGGGGGGIGCVDIGNLVECKQEPDNEFVDLEQCAAALAKDAAANGAGFPGFPDFGDDTGDEIITSDAFKDLLSEISGFDPDLIKDFDFDDKSVETLGVGAPGNVGGGNADGGGGGAGGAGGGNGPTGNTGPGGANMTNNGQIKIEDDKDSVHQHTNNGTASNGVGGGNNGAGIGSNSSPGALGSSQYSPARLPYSGLDFKSEMSPAAQTLKQMAEQHQHKSQQLGLGGFNPNAAAAAAAARGPTARSPYAEFTQFGNTNDYLGSPGNNGPPGNQNQTASNPASYHNKNNGTSAPFQGQQTNDMFSGQNQFSGLADMKRPQQTGGKPNMLGPTGAYKQQYSPYGSPGSMPNHGSPGYPLPPRGSQGGGPNQTGSQGPFTSSTPPRPPSGPGTSTLQINQAQQLHITNPGHQIQVSAGQHMQLTGDLKPGVSVAAQQGMYFNQQQAQNQTGPSGQQTDTYCSVSQSQTINFTQQNIRRAASAAGGGVPQPGNAGAGGRGHPQQVPPGQVDQHQHAKLLQQQQIMRAQQVMQQQQHMAGGMGGVRPPPPEYKAAAQAQMMHAGIGMGQQARFPNAGPMRRVAQQPMPPSGPMMRPQMAQQQQQQALHAAGGNMYVGVNVTCARTGPSMGAIGGMHQMHQRLGYPRTNNQRPPNVNVGPPDTLANSIAGRGAQQEWRHLLMHQQQGFQAQMRQPFNQQSHQGGFVMGGAGGMQMSAAQMQHQQLIRSQSGGMAGSGMANSSQMQQLLSQQHQQQTLAMQQGNNQMSMQMQMSQSSSVNSVTNTGTGSPLHPHQQYGGGSPGVRNMPQQQQQAQQQHSQPPSSAPDPSVGTAAEFSLDLLENLPAGDTSNFNPQELLNSLESTAGFNLDIL